MYSMGKDIILYKYYIIYKGLESIGFFVKFLCSNNLKVFFQIFSYMIYIRRN